MARLYSLAIVATLGAPLALPQQNSNDPQQIIARSVDVSNRDWAAATQFNCSERDRSGQGSKTYEDLMIEGSLYQRLIAVNGKPLSKAQQAEQARKLQEEIAKRKSETPQQRQHRIAKFDAERKRDHALLVELTKAFDFSLIGEQQLGGRAVYVLQAKPRAGYKPPDRDTQVLTGMDGTLWVDKETFQWVRVRAHVFRPVSIEGFIARVEPGTQFELDKTPVSGDIWLAKRFLMRSRAKVMLLFHRRNWEEDSYFNYRPTPASEGQPGPDAKPQK